MIPCGCMAPGYPMILVIDVVIYIYSLRLKMIVCVSNFDEIKAR